MTSPRSAAVGARGLPQAAANATPTSAAMVRLSRRTVAVRPPRRARRRREPRDGVASPRDTRSTLSPIDVRRQAASRNPDPRRDEPGADARPVRPGGEESPLRHACRGEIPVDDIPEGFDVLRPRIAVVDVIRMLPYVAGDQRSLAVHDRAVRIVG